MQLATGASMIDISGILDDVVHQFQDPFAFLRELVQNAIDAGTGEIEIDVVHDGDVAEVTVRDFGSGMNRDIIETQLCRLFSSSKYEDLTSIGRFGIGFVSVYGIEPDFVCVDTGRDGESWRVLFLPDRSYEIYALSQPVEGTEVRVVKAMERDAFHAFRSRVREVVRRWCRHVRTPVFLNGDDQREPFEVITPLGVEFAAEGTRIVAGLVAEHSPTCGYFNRGLMLKETAGGPWPHFVFKVDSRYLDHTLTRDDLLRDTNYQKALTLLEEFATRTLPDELLRVLADIEVATSRRGDELYAVLRGLVRHVPITVKGWEHRALFHGTGRSYAAPFLQRAAEDGTLWFATAPSALVAAVEAEGEHVIISEAIDDIADLLALRPRDVAEHWALLDPEPLPSQLAAAFTAALPAGSARPRSIVAAALGLPASAPPATVVPDLLAAVRRSTLRPASLERLSEQHLVLDTSRPTVRDALTVAKLEPELAAGIVAAALFGEQSGAMLETLAGAMHGE